MASRPKAPMPPAERAKQFLPFAALKGLQEALAEKERDDTEAPAAEEDKVAVCRADARQTVVSRES